MPSRGECGGVSRPSWPMPTLPDGPGLKSVVMTCSHSSAASARWRPKTVSAASGALSGRATDPCSRGTGRKSPLGRCGGGCGWDERDSGVAALRSGVAGTGWNSLLSCCSRLARSEWCGGGARGAGRATGLSRWSGGRRVDVRRVGRVVRGEKAGKSAAGEGRTNERKAQTVGEGRKERRRPSKRGEKDGRTRGMLPRADCCGRGCARPPTQAPRIKAPPQLGLDLPQAAHNARTGPTLVASFGVAPDGHHVRFIMFGALAVRAR